MSYRKNYILTDRKVKELQAQLAEKDKADLRHADDMMVLAEKIKNLEGELDVVRKEKEIAISERDVALSEGRKEGFEAGQEAGLAVGHKLGFEEGQSDRITLKEHHKLLVGSRMAVVRDFLKTNTFTTTGRSNQLTHLSKATRLVKPKLKNFADSRSHLTAVGWTLLLMATFNPILLSPISRTMSSRP